MRVFLTGASGSIGSVSARSDGSGSLRCWHGSVAEEGRRARVAGRTPLIVSLGDVDACATGLRIRTVLLIKPFSASILPALVRLPPRTAPICVTALPTLRLR